MKKIFFYILSIMILTSCSSEENKQKRVKVGERYSISIPSFLTKVDDLHENASLQYQHAWKEFFVIVLEESTQNAKIAIEKNNLSDEVKNNIEGYSEVALEAFKERISVYNQTKVIDTVVNGMPAKVTSIEGEADGIDVYYTIAIIEGLSRYYQVLVWTEASNQREYDEKMKKIVYSLKENNKLK